MEELTEIQIAALYVLDQHLLSRRDDGKWRPDSANVPAFDQADVRLLAAAGLAQLMPVGAFITDAGRAKLREMHLIR
jgi:hypothetical protein